MEVAVEDISDLRKTLKINLPKDIVAPQIKAAYQKLRSGGASLKGFRKGKIPQNVLEKTYGERVKAEVGDKIIQDTYFDALAESKLEAVVHPDIKKIEFGDDGSFSYEAEVEVRPEFELGQYKGLEVEHEKISVSDNELAASLEMTRKEMAPLKGVDGRGAAAGDLVIIDFQGFENGEPVKHLAKKEYSVDLGSGRDGKEFEDMVLGLQSGEEADRKVTFPADFANTAVASKTIEFKIKVKDVKERVLADLDDEFAKDVDEKFNTLDDLRKAISDQIRAEKEKTMEGDVNDKIMLKLLDSHDFELPARLVAYEINELVKELEGNLKRQGISLDSAGLKQEDLAAQYKVPAERRVRGDFIIKKIAEQEEIKLAEEDINAGYERIAEQYSMTVADVKK
ncbi:MAG: trigger factor, partial [Deltaproteobacteria bacterium]|nr:trigger factor [Deltaproteobacteria bacterium]